MDKILIQKNSNSNQKENAKYKLYGTNDNCISDKRRKTNTLKIKKADTFNNGMHSNKKNTNHISSKIKTSITFNTSQNTNLNHTKENIPRDKVIDDNDSNQYISSDSEESEEIIDNTSYDESNEESEQKEKAAKTQRKTEKSEKKNKKVSPRSSKDINNYYRDMLNLARKGDKDSFIEILKKILNKKGDINYKDERGYTALHYACEEGNLKIVDILIKAECDLNSKTLERKTPLHLAAIHGYFDICKALFDNGALLSATDNEKNSVLHFCASNGHVFLLQFFLGKHPNAEVTNIYGKTPMDESKTEEIKLILDNYIKNKGNSLNENNTSLNYTSNDTLKKNDNAKKLRLSPLNSNRVISHITFNHSHMNGMTHTETQNNGIDSLPSAPGTTKSSLGKSKNFMINKLRKNNTGLNSNVISSIKKKDIFDTIKKSSNKAQSLMKKTISFNHNKLKNNTEKQSIKQFVKKTSIPNFKKDSLSLNTLSIKKKSIDSNGNTNSKSGIKKNKTLQKFMNRSTNNKEHSSSNVKIDLSTGSIKNNLTLDSNVERLNKTEESPHLKKLYTSQNGHNITNQDLYSQINLNSIEEEERVTLTSFICLAVLGRGSFGEVFLVQKIDTKQKFAMKVLSKDRIMGQNLLRYVISERNVLSLTNHPFIVRLHYAFQTNHKLFLILEYCPKGDLGLHLKAETKFTEERAKFYICEVLLALEDLHQRGIIFRDLKPENVVLDIDGHAKLTDFGLSKEGVFDSDSAKSFCGSIAYLAPEMVKRQGHGKAVDWYLLGVLFYEMLTGNPPYFNDQK